MQTFEDEYKPKEEGLDNVKLERKVTCFRVHLSLNAATASRASEPGYQAPLDAAEVIPENGPEESESRRQPRNRKGKGGEDDDDDEDDIEDIEAGDKPKQPAEEKKQAPKESAE